MGLLEERGMCLFFFSASSSSSWCVWHVVLQRNLKTDSLLLSQLSCYLFFVVETAGPASSVWSSLTPLFLSYQIFREFCNVLFEAELLDTDC